MCYFLMTLSYEHVLGYMSFLVIFYLCRTKEVNKFKMSGKKEIHSPSQMEKSLQSESYAVLLNSS